MSYTPFEAMERMVEQLRRDMSEWRERGGIDERFGFGTGYALNTDLAESDDEYVLTVDLPGFETDDIDLRYDDRVVYLSASHEGDDESTHRRRVVSERIALPGGVEADDVEATYRNGVLEVHLPKVAGEEAGHRIDID